MDVKPAEPRHGHGAHGPCGRRGRQGSLEHRREALHVTSFLRVAGSSAGNIT
jgi:hypothetical protein